MSVASPVAAPPSRSPPSASEPISNARPPSPAALGRGAAGQRDPRRCRKLKQSPVPLSRADGRPGRSRVTPIGRRARPRRTAAQDPISTPDRLGRRSARRRTARNAGLARAAGERAVQGHAGHGEGEQRQHAPWLHRGARCDLNRDSMPSSGRRLVPMGTVQGGRRRSRRATGPSPDFKVKAPRVRKPATRTQRRRFFHSARPISAGQGSTPPPRGPRGGSCWCRNTPIRHDCADVARRSTRLRAKTA